MTTPSFNIAQDAAATFAAYDWLSDKSDTGSEIAEADVDTNVGAVWGNAVDEAFIQVNEVFQGTRFIDALGIGSAVSGATGAGDDLVVGSTGTANNGMTIRASGQSSIYAADAGSATAARLYYDHSSTRWTVNVEGSDELRVNNAAVFPATDGGLDSGTNGSRWATTYTDDLVVTTTISQDSANPTYTLGSGSGSVEQFLRKSDAGVVNQYWMVGTTTTTTNNKRWRMAGDETLALQNFDGSTWDNVIHVGNADGGSIGFLGATPVARPTVSGSKGGNAALTSLMTALANLGLVTDSTS